MSARYPRRPDPRRRLAQRAGALLTLVAAATALLPPAAAEAAVRTHAGMRGTVLGRSAWYGTYYLTGIGPALCIDADKAAPDSDFAYKRGATITGTLGAQLAYTATTYGATTDTVTAIAAKLVMHDLVNARYPHGELDVTRLQPSQLANFGGRERTIVTKARAVMADVRANYRTGPYRLTLKTPATLDASNRAAVTVTLLDGRGKPLAGFTVTLAGSNTTRRTVTVTTGSTGQAGATFTAADPATTVRISASATLPSPQPVVFAPTRPDMAGRAQRVVIGGLIPLTTTTSTAARDVSPPPGTTVRITVTKTGDATAYHPVTGATFELRAGSPTGPRLAGPVTIGADGRATFGETITTDIDSVWLVETTAPPGYTLADPVAVPTEGVATVGVANHAVPGTATLRKVDAHTREPVAGAVLRLRYDSDDDGDYDTDLGTVITAAAPVTVSDLLPGRYQVTEERPPPGYQLPADTTQTALLDPGGTLTVTFADIALTTVTFAKTPTGSYDPDNYTLADAVFVVTDDTGREAGRCTTTADGRCTLPARALVTGDDYCWEEIAAPPGFAPAQGGCFTAGHPTEATVVGVAEEGTYLDIEITKHAAGNPARTLPRATYQLIDRDSGDVLATATTGADGTLTFPPVLPGRVYCVRETTAPPGYVADPAAHCTDGPAVTDVAFVLENTAAPTPTATPTAPPTPRPTTAAPTPRATPTVPPATHTELPRTGTDTTNLLGAGLATVTAGAALTAAGTATRPHRRYRGRHRRDRSPRLRFRPGPGR